MPFIDTGEVRIHYEELGDADLPAVLLLHGLTGRGSNWGAVPTRLRDRGFRVVALDLRGHGLSGRGEDHRVGAHVRDVVRVAERICPRAVHLVGHSLGGAIAWEVAASRPELVVRLVVEDQHPEADTAIPAEWRTRVETWPRRFASRADALDFLRSGGRNVDWYGPSIVELAGGGWGWAFDLDAAAETSRSLYAADSWDRLRAIAAPTLLIRGERSTHLSAEVARRMAATIPQCRLVEIPGAEHWVHRLAEPYVSAVAAFLGEA